MLAELRLELNTDEKIGATQASLFQGVLMENINPEYASIMHFNNLHPYSQHIEFNGKLFWVICVTNKEAYDNIIEPLLSPSFNSFELRKRETTIKITSKSVRTLEHKELLSDFYLQQSDRYLTIEFVSPTSFKRNNRYEFFPDARLIFGSFMNKYSSSSEALNMTDEDTLNYIDSNTQIISYQLKSVRYPLEGVTIPAFKGRLTFKIHGTDTMVAYMNMLARFGEFSGVGIKCAMGMGAIRIIKRGETKDAN